MSGQNHKRLINYLSKILTAETRVFPIKRGFSSSNTKRFFTSANKNFSIPPVVFPTGRKMVFNSVNKDASKPDIMEFSPTTPDQKSKYSLEVSMLEDPTQPETSKLKKFPPPIPTHPLCKAAHIGDIATLEKDLEHICHVDEFDNSVLIWAVDGGQTEVVEFIAKNSKTYKANKDNIVNKRGYLGATALARACRYGHLEVIEKLFECFGEVLDPNIPNNKLQYPMHFAAFQQHEKVIEFLLKSGKCDLSVTDRKGRTPAEDTKNEKIKEMINIAAKEQDDMEIGIKQV